MNARNLDAEAYNDILDSCLLTTLWEETLSCLNMTIYLCRKQVHENGLQSPAQFHTFEPRLIAQQQHLTLLTYCGWMVNPCSQFLKSYGEPYPKSGGKGGSQLYTDVHFNHAQVYCSGICMILTMWCIYISTKTP